MGGRLYEIRTWVTLDHKGFRVVVNQVIGKIFEILSICWIKSKDKAFSYSYLIAVLWKEKKWIHKAEIIEVFDQQLDPSLIEDTIHR